MTVSSVVQELMFLHPGYRMELARLTKTLSADDGINIPQNNNITSQFMKLHCQVTSIQ